MNIMKRAAVSIAAVSAVLAPVAASAAPALDGARATSAVDDANDMEGSSWIAKILGLLIIAGGVWLAIDGDDDPVSP